MQVTIMVDPLVTLSKSCKMKTTIWTLIAAGTVFDSFIDCLRSKLSVHDEITCKIMTEPDGETKYPYLYCSIDFLIGVCPRPLLVSFVAFIPRQIIAVKSTWTRSISPCITVPFKFVHSSAPELVNAM